MDQVPADTRLFLFESSTHVFWVEEIAREEGIPVEVVPAPKEARNSCGLAVRTLSKRAADLTALLEDEGIPFKPHPHS